MNIVYIQCDMRMNSNLLCPFAAATVIGIVVEKFRDREGITVVADMYDCIENAELVHYLRSLGVDVRLSIEDDITRRLINFCETLKENGYIIRISGSQVLLNMEYFQLILDEMTRKDKDFFYCKYNDGQVPEVVKSSLIVQYKDTIKEYARYYQALEIIPDLDDLKFSYPAMPIKVCASNKSMISIIERYYCSGNIDALEDRIREVVYRMGSRSYITASGYVQTLIDSELFDSNRKPIPWYTYSIIYFLKTRLRKDMTVFEFGSGSSTMFFSNHVQSVISIEHDYQWYQKVISDKPENVTIQYVQLEYGGDYSKAISKYSNNFDIVCIDGRDRCNCAKNCVSALKQDGVIIFDDTDCVQYTEAYQYLKAQGFKQLEFCGLIPSLIYPNGSTSIFYRLNNCMGI